MPFLIIFDMKRTLMLLILVAEISFVYSQNYDLIVKTNGDSIACRIDSITDSLIHFMMMNRRSWINTNIDKEFVTEYQYNIIDWKNYEYKPGTSYILSLIKPVNSIWDLHKNSVYVGYYILAMPAIYERTIPIGNRIGILAGGGIIQTVAFYSSTNPVAKTGLIFGNGKHFLEVGSYIDLMHKKEHLNLIIPVLGYRYQALRGFVLRADFALITPGISIGYSF